MYFPFLGLCIKIDYVSKFRYCHFSSFFPISATFQKIIFTFFLFCFFSAKNHFYILLSLLFFFCFLFSLPFSSVSSSCSFLLSKASFYLKLLDFLSLLKFLSFPLPSCFLLSFLLVSSLECSSLERDKSLF